MNSNQHKPEQAKTKTLLCLHILYHGLRLLLNIIFPLFRQPEISIVLIFVRIKAWKAIIWKGKVREKQTPWLRSRRKPVKPGDRGQLSQIHITERSYKSSRGGVSVDPEKINPSLTIQGHQHRTHTQARTHAHTDTAWATKTSNKDKIYIHHSGADTVRLTWRNTTQFAHICLHSRRFSDTCTHTRAHTLTLQLSHAVEGMVMMHWNFSAWGIHILLHVPEIISHGKRLTRHYFSLVYGGQMSAPHATHTKKHTHAHKH